MKRLILIATALFALTTTAHAFGDIVLVPPAKEKPDRGNGADDHPFPYDAGRMNESPIRGAGRISVVHNEPPTESAESKITAARWLLQDNGYQCSMPRRR